MRDERLETRWKTRDDGQEGYGRQEGDGRQEGGERQEGKAGGR